MQEESENGSGEFSPTQETSTTGYNTGLTPSFSTTDNDYSTQIGTITERETTTSSKPETTTPSEPETTIQSEQEPTTPSASSTISSSILLFFFAVYLLN